MKYFKYKKINKVQKLAEKEYLASLDKDEKKKTLRSKFLTKFLGFLSFSLFIIIYGICIFLIKLIPLPSVIILELLYAIGCLLLGIISLVGSAFIAFAPFLPILKKIEYNPPIMKKEFIKKACKPMREYYGLQDDYLITKCFNSTNTLFNNHDICIFRFENEIRITTNIVFGFIKGSSDLGCYSIKFNELTLYKTDYNNKRSTVIEFENETFIIGIKAYSYINELIKTKVYKYLLKRLEINEKYIYVKKNKKVQKIEVKNIEKVNLQIPKFTGIPGSGYDYSYTIRIFEKNKPVIEISMVLERNEEKEIINFLKDNNIISEIEYYDNKDNYSD